MKPLFLIKNPGVCMCMHSCVYVVPDSVLHGVCGDWESNVTERKLLSVLFVK